MQVHHLRRPNSLRRPKRVGRGGKRGKTSGRGTKGQKARAGRRIRPAVRDVIEKIPKLRGHGVNRAQSVVVRPKPQAVALAALEAAFAPNDRVTPQALVRLGLLRRTGGRPRPATIVANGDITKPLTIIGCRVSAKAREKIKAAGGEVVD
ncbi:MAG: 50S ribosomal protein L15 [Candidatus Parcubacteria bacterium]|nr:MAG: 50S ribosomal protein L15 [Candidatus Parcubacteria bacterium]